MALEIDLNYIKPETPESSEKEPEVVMTDRGHHIVHISEMLNWAEEESTPIEISAYDYTYSVFHQRQATVEYMSAEVKLLLNLLENFELLQKLPWFKKLLGTLVQNSFSAKFAMEKYDQLPDWNNINVLFVDLLAYIMASVWPEHIDDILNIEGYFDKTCIEQLVFFNTDLADLDKYIEKNAESIRGSGFQFTKLATNSLIEVMRNPDYRVSILPILAQAPMYLESTILSYIESRFDRLDYYKDIGVEPGQKEIDSTWNFDTMGFICTHINYAYKKNPNDYIEFVTTPGAICESAGTFEGQFGRHCKRKTNADGDARFLNAIENILPYWPQYIDLVTFSYDKNWNIVSIKIPLHIVADEEFVKQVNEYQSKIRNDSDKAAEA